MQAGEERFAVDLMENGDVWFEAMSVSRPSHPLSFLAYPLVSYLQYKFLKEGTASVASWVREQRAQADGAKKKR